MVARELRAVEQAHGQRVMEARDALVVEAFQLRVIEHLGEVIEAANLEETEQPLIEDQALVEGEAIGAWAHGRHPPQRLPLTYDRRRSLPLTNAPGVSHNVWPLDLD